MRDLFLGTGYYQRSFEWIERRIGYAKAALERNYGTIDLKPQFQQVWDQLNKAYNIYDMGWLQINPQTIRINNLYAKDDSLYVYLGLSASPVISFEKPVEQKTAIPLLAISNGNRVFPFFWMLC